MVKESTAPVEKMFEIVWKDGTTVTLTGSSIRQALDSNGMETVLLTNIQQYIMLYENPMRG